MREQKINHLAVWLCVIVFQVLSVLWYSPLLFAGKWMNYLGKTFDDFKGESMAGLIFSIFGAVVFNYFLAWLFARLKINKRTNGLLMAFFLALGCFVFETFTQDGFSLRPLGLSLINTGSILLNFCFAGLLLGGCTKYKTIKSNT